MNQWFGEQSKGSKYGAERQEINAEAEESDVGSKKAMQRQQSLCRANKACVIHAEAAGVTQKAREVAQSLSRLTQRSVRPTLG